MYDELVKRLRHCSEEHSGCGTCELSDTCVLQTRLLLQAANAIEELSKLVDAIPHVCECCVGCELEKKNGRCDYGFVLSPKRAMQYLIKPRWIPVTERLPEEYKDVLCYYEYFRYGDYNCMFRTIDRGYYGNGRWGGEAGQGHKNKVLAWMPLPEPPKEET